MLELFHSFCVGYAVTDIAITLGRFALFVYHNKKN